MTFFRKQPNRFIQESESVKLTLQTIYSQQYLESEIIRCREHLKRNCYSNDSNLLMCEGYLKDLYPDSLFVVKDSESTKPYPIQEDVQIAPVIAPVIAPTLKRKNAKKLTISPNTQELPTEKVIPCKIAKKKISAAIKKLVWNTNIGEEIGKSKCMCCNSTDITQMSFNCGHIVAEAKGGKTIVSNLKPICQNCNSSMGTTNMNDFMKTLK